jgi:hypothetical protein
MKGIVVRDNGTIEQVDVAHEWEAIVDLIGGFMEIIRNGPGVLATPGIVMVVDEEGLLKRRPYNVVASYLYGEALHGQPIVGDVLIIGEGMGPEGADFCDLPDPDSTLAALLRTQRGLS